MQGHCSYKTILCEIINMQILNSHFYLDICCCWNMMVLWSCMPVFKVLYKNKYNNKGVLFGKHMRLELIRAREIRILAEFKRTI